MVPAHEWDVVVVGELFLDEILADFPTLPKLGEEAFAQSLKREAGGGAAITAAALARLGVRVAVLGVIGPDGFWIRDRLTALGVSTRFLQVDKQESTGLTVSVSTREDRAFFSYYGANTALAEGFRQPKWTGVMCAARHVHIATSPQAKLDLPFLKLLRQKGCRISIDVQSNVSWLTEPASLQVLKAVDLFLPNEQEAEWISGETGTRAILSNLRSRGLRKVGLKLGGKGAALAWNHKDFLVDTFPVLAKDTTGAGDCFNAGFLYAWLNRQPPLTCLEIANYCGALSTRELGGIDGFPTARELRDFMGKKRSK